MRKFRTTITTLMLAIALACCFKAAPAHALFGTITIEDLMEEFGITRSDRVKEMTKNAKMAYDLMDALPKQFYSLAELPNGLMDMVTKMPGDIISEFTKDFKLDTSLWDKLKELAGQQVNIGGAGTFAFDNAIDLASEAEGLFEKYRNVVKQTAGNTLSDAMGNNGSGQQASSSEEKHIDIYAALQEAIEKEYGDNYTNGMKELDPTLFAGADQAIFNGLLEQPNAHNTYNLIRDAQNVMESVRGARLAKISEILAEAETVRNAISEDVNGKDKEQMSSTKILEKYSDGAGSKSSNKEGMAWGNIAASYTALTALQNVNQISMLHIHNLMLLRLRMKAQICSLAIADYAEFAYTMMHNINVIYKDKNMSLED